MLRGMALSGRTPQIFIQCLVILLCVFFLCWLVPWIPIAQRSHWWHLFQPVWFGLQMRGEFCPEDRDNGITKWYSPDCRLSFLFGWRTHFREKGRKINAALVELWEIWGLARAGFQGFCGWLEQGRKNHFPCLLRKIIKRYYALDSVRVIACICWRAFFFWILPTFSCLSLSTTWQSYSSVFIWKYQSRWQTISSL